MFKFLKKLVSKIKCSFQSSCCKSSLDCEIDAIDPQQYKSTVTNANLARVSSCAW